MMLIQFNLKCPAGACVFSRLHAPEQRFARDQLKMPQPICNRSCDASATAAEFHASSSASPEQGVPEVHVQQDERQQRGELFSGHPGARIQDGPQGDGLLRESPATPIGDAAYVNAPLKSHTCEVV